jgi:NAD(P)-dependent dehydrogenase (short-subunit alcohol dehydrogenase family)
MNRKGNQMRLQNKVAIVTGAVGNIGVETVKLFLEHGASVMLVDRDRARIDAALAELRSDRADGIVADVTKADDVKRYVDATVRRFGKVDIFFNNAGIEGAVKTLVDYPEDSFDEVMAVNVKGVFLGMKYVVPQMNDGGSIIITSSIMGLAGSMKTIGYTASKHAVVGIMRSAAKILGPRRIRVNTVHPGFVESEMLRRIEANDVPDDPQAARQKRLAEVPMGRYVVPREIAESVLFLASGDSRMTTGQTLVVDGGYLL